MASTIIIPNVGSAKGTLYEGLANVFDTYTRGVKQRRLEEERERARMARSMRAKGRGGGRGRKRSKYDIDRLKGLVAISKSEPITKEAREQSKYAMGGRRRDFGFTAKEIEDAKYASMTEFPKYLRDEVAKDITGAVKKPKQVKVQNILGNLHGTSGRKGLEQGLAGSMYQSALEAGKLNEQQFTNDESLEASRNVIAALERIRWNNPEITKEQMLSIYESIMSDPNNYLTITEDTPSTWWRPGTWGDDTDAVPMKVNEILKRYTAANQRPRQSWQDPNTGQTRFEGQGPRELLDRLYSGSEEQTTSGGQTFTGVHAQTGESITVTEKEIIDAARARFPNEHIEVAIAKVKKELGLK
jgi:hypothetical protein